MDNKPLESITTDFFKARCRHCGELLNGSHTSERCLKNRLRLVNDSLWTERQRVKRMGGRIHAQRELIGKLNLRVEQVVDAAHKAQDQALQHETELQAKLSEIQKTLDETAYDLDVERRTRADALEFLRLDVAREQASTKQAWTAYREQKALTQTYITGNKKLGDEIQLLRIELQRKEGARLEAEKSKIQLEASIKAAKTSQLHWEEEAKTASRERDRLIRQLADQKLAFEQEKVNYRKIHILGNESPMGGSEAVLYYCGCQWNAPWPSPVEGVRQKAPVFCPFHYSPQTREGMIDGR